MRNSKYQFPDRESHNKGATYLRASGVEFWLGCNDRTNNFWLQPIFKSQSEFERFKIIKVLKELGGEAK